MGLSVGQQARRWGFGFVGLLALLWLVSDAIAPFILGAALAYLLDPLADRLEGWKLSRTWATVQVVRVFNPPRLRRMSHQRTLVPPKRTCGARAWSVSLLRYVA